MTTNLFFLKFLSLLFFLKNFIFLSQATPTISYYYNYSTTIEKQWENYYSSIVVDLFSKSFRFPEKLNLPSYIIKKNQNQPCELFNTILNNPSIYTIYSNIYQIKNENLTSNNLIYNDNLNCYVLNLNDLNCKVNLPISRCSDNDSPNSSDFNNFNSLLIKNNNFKISMESFYSIKQSFHYYINSFLKQFSNINQYNRIDQYYSDMINQLIIVIESLIDLSQPSIPKNIGLQLSLIDNSILTDSIKFKIIDQTSFTINTIINSLNQLLIELNNLQIIKPSSITSTTTLSFIDTTIFSTIQFNLNQLNDYQNQNINLYFGSSQQFSLNLLNLFNSGQTLLEYYLEFKSTSNLINSLIQEIQIINQFLLQYSQQSQQISTIIYNNNLQLFNFNQFQKFSNDLKIINSLIKSSTNINNQSNNINNNSFYCSYLIFESIINSFDKLINPTQFSSVQQNDQLIFKSMTFGDIGFCREIYQRNLNLKLDLTISNQLQSNRVYGNSINQDILLYDFVNIIDGAKFITSNLFLSIIKDYNSFQFQKDGYVLNISYPVSTSKPNKQLPPGPFPVVSNDPSLKCQYPTCFLQAACVSKPMASLYYRNGECDYCVDNPPNSYRTYLGGVLVDGIVGISPYCPYVCILPKQYKLGDADDYNQKPCVDVPIGYYSPSYNNTVYQCTIPSNFTLVDRLGFGTNAAYDSCMVTPKYQLIFVNSSYNSERNVLPSSVLDRGKTIEMWLSIQQLPQEDTVLGLTGVLNSWELSFFYKSSTKTITPAITDPNTSSIIFSDSSINIPTSLLLSNYFHFAIVIENNNILSFYLNAKRLGKTLFSSSKLNQTPGYQYIGGQQFNRMSFLIDEYHNYDQALSPNQLGYNWRSEMLQSSCNAQINEQLCNGNCIACDSQYGLQLNQTDCTCQCSDNQNMELINGKCLAKCPINSFRDPTNGMNCSCIDGEFKIATGNFIKISSFYQYDHPDNYYSTNTDKKIGIKSIQLFNEIGQTITPISCSSSSNDGVNDCFGLFDLSSSTYWMTSSFTGFGYVLLNLKNLEKISKISIEPLPNTFTMKSISITISKDSIQYESFLNQYQLPMQVNTIIIDFTQVPNDMSKLYQCISCPTMPLFQESPQSIQYPYPPISSLPRDNYGTCGCFTRFSFDASSYACMPPLPSPSFTLPSGPYKTNTLVNLIYNIQQTTGYTLRYTIDSSDPLETSMLFPTTQGLTFNNIETVILKVRSFKSGRLTSDVASAVYYIQGLINCTLSPTPSNTIYDVSLTVFINCETTPSYSSIASSWIFYTIDDNEPTIFSDKYNPKYGVQLQSTPTIGMNLINFKILSQLDQYFSFTGSFFYKIQPTIPPPIFSPPDQLNFTNFVNLKILVPSITDNISTSVSTTTYYQNYNIYYDIIPQGQINPSQLTITSGQLYNFDQYVIVECSFPSQGCLLHLRAIGCINQACSVVSQRYFKLTFNMTELAPTIISKYSNIDRNYLITIQSNSNILGLSTFYSLKFYQTRDDSALLDQCQKDLNITNELPDIQYSASFNISSSELKGYYCICSRNFKNYKGNLLNSLQICKLLVYTDQMDSPIILQHGEYITPSLKLNIYENITRLNHQGSFRVEVNNGDPTEQSQLLNSSFIVLNLSSSLSYQMFHISAIDCAKGYICSEPSTTSITLRAKCPNPYLSKPSGTYYNNITLYGYCDNQCSPVYQFINSSNQDQIQPLSISSSVFPTSITLSSPYNEETQIVILMMCVDQSKSNSDTIDFQYNIQKYYRPNKPIIEPSQSGILGSNDLINMTCETLDSRESCIILFSIKYADSKSTAPLEIDAIKQSHQTYDYQYVRPFRPNLAGHFYIVAITFINKPYLVYDYNYSTENQIEISVYSNNPSVEMIPNIKLFYPSISILLTSSELINQGTVLYYLANESDQYFIISNNQYPSFSKFSIFNQSTTLLIKSTCNIYAFINGKYYNPITESSIQTFSLIYNNQSNQNDNHSNDNNDNDSLKYLSLLVLLSGPIGYFIYKFYNFILYYKYKKLLKNSKRTGLLLEKK